MTIGQLARAAGINPRTLRYYEHMGLLTPSARTEAGYRLYTERDAERLAFIRRAQSLGLSLAEIADIISVREGGAPPCRHVRTLAETKVQEIDERVRELEKLRSEMVRLAQLAHEVESECAGSSSICLAFEPAVSASP